MAAQGLEKLPGCRIPDAHGVVARDGDESGAVRAEFDGCDFAGHPRAPFLWMKLPDPWLSATFKQAAANEAWTAAFHAELAAGGAATYVNFMGDEGADAVRDAYPASSYARLRELKRRYDPDNVFRANHNIPPA